MSTPVYQVDENNFVYVLGQDGLRYYYVDGIWTPYVVESEAEQNASFAPDLYDLATVAEQQVQSAYDAYREASLEQRYGDTLDAMFRKFPCERCGEPIYLSEKKRHWNSQKCRRNRY